jgi:hypothetical protein
MLRQCAVLTASADAGGAAEHPLDPGDGYWARRPARAAARVADHSEVGRGPAGPWVLLADLALAKVTPTPATGLVACAWTAVNATRRGPLLAAAGALAARRAAPPSATARRRGRGGALGAPPRAAPPPTRGVLQRCAQVCQNRTAMLPSQVLHQSCDSSMRCSTAIIYYGSRAEVLCVHTWPRLTRLAWLILRDSHRSFCRSLRRAAIAGHVRPRSRPRRSTRAGGSTAPHRRR